MVSLLTALAALSVLAGIVFAFLQNGGVGGFIVALIYGIVPAVVFYALALILDHLEQLHLRLERLERRPQPPAPKLGNSKADIGKLKDFKI